MSTIVRRYPAVSLLILAMIFGVAPVVAVNAGLLPQGASQLGALLLAQCERDAGRAQVADAQ